MKLVEWKDKDGWRHRSLIRNGDPPSRAPQGLPQDPPDVRKLDWEAIKTALHNELFVRGLFTLEDVRRAQNALGPAILAVTKRRLLTLYREEFRDSGRGKK